MEDRRAIRIAAAVGVIVEVDGKQHPCLTGTLSAGGMLVQLRHPAPVGTEISVTVLDEGKKTKFRARIATNHGSGMGLGFVGLSPEQREEWHQFLKKLVRRSTTGVDATPDLTAQVAWSHIPDGRLLTLFKKRLRHDRLIDLTLDGAAFANGGAPEVGTPLLIFLTEVTSGERHEYHCQAIVVRHLDGGFAVRFDQPGVEFRGAVSRLRQSLAIG